MTVTPSRALALALARRFTAVHRSLAYMPPCSASASYTREANKEARTSTCATGPLRLQRRKVEEHRQPILAAPVLQRRGNEVPEAALGEHVLVGNRRS